MIGVLVVFLEQTKQEVDGVKNIPGIRLVDVLDESMAGRVSERLNGAPIQKHHPLLLSSGFAERKGAAVRVEGLRCEIRADEALVEPSHIPKALLKSDECAAHSRLVVLIFVLRDALLPKFRIELGRVEISKLFGIVSPRIRLPAVVAMARRGFCGG